MAAETAYTAAIVDDHAAGGGVNGLGTANTGTIAASGADIVVDFRARGESIL